MFLSTKKYFPHVTLQPVSNPNLVPLKNDPCQADKSIFLGVNHSCSSATRYFLVFLGWTAHNFSTPVIMHHFASVHPSVLLCERYVVHHFMGTGLLCCANVTWVRVKGHIVQGQIRMPNKGRWAHNNVKLLHFSLLPKPHPSGKQALHCL